MSERLKGFARILASVLMMGLILYFCRNELDEVILILKGARLPILAMVFLIWMVAHVLFGWRLKLILAVQEVHLRLRDCFAVVMAGMFFNNFIPTVVGGDVAKGVYLTRFINKKKESYSSIFLDRLIGIITLMLIGMGALAIFHVAFYDARAKYSFLFCTAAAIFGLVFFLNRDLARRVTFLRRIVPVERFQTMAREFYDAIHGYRKHPVAMGMALLISFVGQSATVVCVYFLARAIDVDVPMKIFFVFFPLISFASLAPSVNGLGAREAMFLFYLTSYCGKESALAISVLLDMLFIVSGLFGGLFVGFQKKIALLEKQSTDGQARLATRESL